MRLKLLWIVALGIVLLIPLFLVRAQSENNNTISAENVRQLQPIIAYDFADVPEGILTASGLFAMNADASRVVTFGRLAETEPLSQAILWGYADTPIANRIDGGSILRFLSDDGRCLYAGYRSYFAVWQLEAESDEATLLYHSDDFTGDTVNALWLDTENPSGDEGCNTRLYAEYFSAESGQSFVVDPDGEIVVPQLFSIQDDDLRMVRIGRIEVPFAITATFEGELFLWDISGNEILASAQAEALAAYGALSHDGRHFAWFAGDYNGLFLSDFSTSETRLVAELGGVYLSHMDVSHDASVIFGTDPQDNRGRVNAWLSDTGERIDLGAYRPCERTQPDMADISPDGSALVIGCDLGVQVWRIVEK